MESFISNAILVNSPGSFTKQLKVYKVLLQNFFSTRENG